MLEIYGLPLEGYSLFVNDKYLDRLLSSVEVVELNGIGDLSGVGLIANRYLPFNKALLFHGNRLEKIIYLDSEEAKEEGEK